MALPNSQSRDDLVVLVHGMSGKRFWMRALEIRLRRWGYSTLNWTYPSLRGSLVVHGDRLAQTLESTTAASVHVVAHSMGAIIARLALARSRGISGRFVMLAPPNRGSPLARAITPVVGRAVPAIGEISSRPGSLVNTLKANETQAGIVAAKFDILVPVSSTRLEDVARVRVAATHNSLLVQPSVAKLVHAFLQTGRFT